MQFKEGDKIHQLYFSDEQLLTAGTDCDQIVVSMENGQMAGVPWFECYKGGKIISKWNGAMVEGATPLDEDSQ